MRAISKDNNKINIVEPFDGLFTQIWSVMKHKDPDNNWVSQMRL